MAALMVRKVHISTRDHRRFNKKRVGKIKRPKSSPPKFDMMVVDMIRKNEQTLKMAKRFAEMSRNQQSSREGLELANNIRMTIGKIAHFVEIREAANEPKTKNFRELHQILQDLQ
jgi:hypothetical protein